MKAIIYIMLYGILSTVFAPCCAEGMPRHNVETTAVASSESCCSATTQDAEKSHCGQDKDAQGHSDELPHPPCHCMCCHALGLIAPSVSLSPIPVATPHRCEFSSQQLYGLQFIHSIWQPPQIAA